MGTKLGFKGALMERPCDFLKDYLGLDCCPNYGSSDCPITMKTHDECGITKEYLLEILSYFGGYYSKKH